MPIDRSNFPVFQNGVPGSHHPSVVTKWEEPLDADGTPGPMALTAAVSALKALYTAEGEALAVRKELAQHVQGKPVMQGPNLKLRHGFERQYAEGVQRIKERVLRSFDSYHAQVSRTQTQLAQQVQAALIDKNTTPAVQAEIRAYIRSLPEKERVSFVSSRDLATYAAAVAAPAYLSGLRDEQLAAIATQAEQRFAPQANTQHIATSEISEHLARVRQAFVAWAENEIAEANTPAARAVAKVKELGR
jgi:hypothetical protein